MCVSTTEDGSKITVAASKLIGPEGLYVDSEKKKSLFADVTPVL